MECDGVFSLNSAQVVPVLGHTELNNLVVPPVHWDVHLQTIEKVLKTDILTGMTIVLEL